MVPSTFGWTKLNFDEASRGNPDTASIICIINNASGMWISRRDKSIHPTTNNLMELEALQVGLQLCLDLVIEGDSQIILNAIRKCSTPNWVLNSKLEEVLNILDQFTDIQILHIYRESNKKVDQLANKGADGEDFLIFNNL
jgi:ribonuclease HI